MRGIALILPSLGYIVVVMLLHHFTSIMQFERI